MRGKTFKSWAFGLAIVSFAGASACGTDEPTGGDAPLEIDSGDDTYAHQEPKSVDTMPASLQPQTWLDHLRDDLMPYWMMSDAHGDPVGNFPTFRDMRGRPASTSTRHPRMLSRQTYAYAMGYALTGDEDMLALARAGAEWLMTHAPDEVNGGYHTTLDGMGEGNSTACKTAQDAAYVMLGVGAYYFVTRDPAAEAFILDGRDLLFDPAVYWDEENQRIRDAVEATDLSLEVDVNGACTADGGWELVAQLDPINAFMLLTQPVLSSEQRRIQFLNDLRTLSQTMVDDFLEDGIFWGLHNVRERGTRHVDYGHTLKAYWMILQVDKRLQDHPFHDVLLGPAEDGNLSNVEAMVTRAHRDGRWNHSPSSRGGENSRPDWWIYAEADQTAATLAMGGADFVLPDESGPDVAVTSANWISDFVDPRGHGEVIPGITADGSPVFNWPESDTAKCNQWKNGYHSVEHALVMTLFSSWMNDVPFRLYFALPADQADSALLRPYFFQGKLAERTNFGDIDGTDLQKIRGSFVDLF